MYKHISLPRDIMWVDKWIRSTGNRHWCPDGRRGWNRKCVIKTHSSFISHFSGPDRELHVSLFKLNLQTSTIRMYSSRAFIWVVTPLLVWLHSSKQINPKTETTTAQLVTVIIFTVRCHHKGKQKIENGSSLSIAFGTHLLVPWWMEMISKGFSALTCWTQHLLMVCFLTTEKKEVALCQYIKHSHQCLIMFPKFGSDLNP